MSMNEDRLRTLAAFLLTVPPREFDLESWRVVTDDKATGELLDVTEESYVLSPPTCGTTACAVGWACSIPAFQQMGLAMYVDADDWETGFYPVFRDSDGWYAVEKFFGITDPEAKYLFSPDHYLFGEDSSPTGVADRISAFVANRGIPVW